MSTFKEDCRQPAPIGLRVLIDISVWVWAVPITVLLISIFALPYGYYQALRVIVTVFAAYLAWKEFDCNGRAANSFVFIFGAIAAIFNPFVPVHLTKETWIVVDFVSAAIFFGHLRVRSRLPDNWASIQRDEALLKKQAACDASGDIAV